jgi:hypothetical protein
MRMVTPAVLCGIVMLSACSGNTGGNAKAAADSTARPMMSARERLAKNNILEKHMTWDSKHLKGKVMTMSKVTYKLGAGNDKKEDSRSVDSFDAKGYVVSGSSKWKDGEHRYTIMYDANGNDTCLISFGPDGKLLGKSLNRYDGRGNEVEQVMVDDGKATPRGSFKYDDKDNLVEMDLYSTTGGANMRCVYKYDENGFKKVGLMYDTSGKVADSIACHYDAAGNQLQSTMYRANGTVSMRWEFKYDGAGHCIESGSYKGNDTLDDKELARFDDHGKPTERVHYKADGSIDEKSTTYYTYEYDATGNATKVTTYKLVKGQKVPDQLEEITYRYY